MEEYPSILLSNAVNQMASLPGMGRKTALRHVLALLKRPENEVQSFADAMVKLKKEVHYCRICHNLTDEDVCSVCSSNTRSHAMICVVENIQDVMSIERTGQYSGVYHVLGGIISPMDGIGPKDLEIDSLVTRVENGGVEEIILALPTTMEGDTTTFYIYRRLASYGVKISQIARGVAVGNDLEYTDEITLGRSILNRIEYNGTQRH